MIRNSLLVVFLVGLAGGSGALRAQSMVETAAAAAGGSAGGIAGKKVSDGLSKIFDKVDKQAAKAADATKNDAAKSRRAVPDAPPPILQVGPGVPQSDGSNVPPPPPVRHAAVRKSAPVERRMPVIEPTPVVPAAPPAPDVTAADLKRVTSGMLRDELLKLGSPAARISMVDDGHLLEIYRYQMNETTFGVVRLTDGTVSTVVVR